MGVYLTQKSLKNITIRKPIKRQRVINAPQKRARHLVTSSFNLSRSSTDAWSWAWYLFTRSLFTIVTLTVSCTVLVIVLVLVITFSRMLVTVSCTVVVSYAISKVVV